MEEFKKKCIKSNKGLHELRLGVSMSYNINERLSNLIFIELKDLTILDKISPYLYKRIAGERCSFPLLI